MYLLAKPSLLRDTIQNNEASPSRIEEIEPSNDVVSESTMALTSRQTGTGNDTLLDAATGTKPLEDWRCTCKGETVQETTTWNFYGISLKSRLTNTHRRNCFRFSEKRNTSIKSLSFLHTSRLLGRIIQLNLNLQNGAGGMSVGPNLTVKGIYRPNSPIRAVIEELPTVFFRMDGHTVENYADSLREASLRIRRTLQKGECSLYDVDEGGRTIMKVLDASANIPIYAEHI